MHVNVLYKVSGVIIDNNLLQFPRTKRGKKDQKRNGLAGDSYSDNTFLVFGVNLFAKP